MTLAIAGTAQYGYLLTKSVRFRASAAAYMNRTPSVAGNRKTWTWSGWIKRGLISDGNYRTILEAYTGAADTYTDISLNSDSISVLQDNGAGGVMSVTTTAVLRDPSSWYHLVVGVDTTQATGTNRVKIYLNGVQQAATFAVTPTQNLDTWVNSTNPHKLATRWTGALTTNGFDGLMAEVNFIDGQQLTPSSFGTYSGFGGVWQPVKYTGTYGTNGYYLPFTNTTSTTTLGYDFSGNGNNWTVNNFSLTAGATYDSMTDVPTLNTPSISNYCTWNPLNQFAGSGGVLYNGNLTFQSPSGVVAAQTVGGTMAVSSGKWYYEVKMSTLYNSLYLQAVVGWSFLNTSTASGSSTHCYLDAYTTTTLQGGSDIKKNGTNVQTNLPIINGGDLIGVAFDADNLTMTFYRNNVIFGSQVTGLTAGTYMPQLSLVSSDGAGNRPIVDVNFGQQPFTYTPPSGYVALNAYNFKYPSIPAGNIYMDATLYTGTGANLTVTNAGSFQPDLVWIKSRSAATDNKLTDSLRGATLAVISNSNAAQTTDTTGLISFNSTGFTLGNSTTYNNATSTYVGWQWQAGKGVSSNNTSGTITSTVSVNQAAGFSVVTYAGTLSSAGTATVGHGLGVAPAMIISKSRNNSNDSGSWCVQHTGLANPYLILQLNNSNGTANISANGTMNYPTSTVFTTSWTTGLNNSGSNYIAYCWAPIDGFSSFGSYTGNGSTSGPFIYTGFRAKFVLVKKSSASGTAWSIVDTTRSTYNVCQLVLRPDSSAAEVTASVTPPIDILANGFKCRSAWDDYNANGATYVYAAFAENPFKYALAR